MTYQIVELVVVFADALRRSYGCFGHNLQPYCALILERLLFRDCLFAADDAYLPVC